MANNEEWMNEAKARLAKPRKHEGRAGSIAARVAMLHPELMAGRAAGKTWAEIASDLSGDQPFNTDAVRIAFTRATQRVDGARAPSRTTTANAAVTPNKSSKVQPTGSNPIPAEAESAQFDDMFAPLFDARDTRGRGGDLHRNEEENA